MACAERVAQIGEHAALDDAEEGLVGARARGETALRPAQRALERRFRASPRLGIGDVGAEPPERPALVERHRDVGAERLLDRDGAFGCELAACAVARRRERDAFLGDDGAIAERRHLVAAAVGEPRAAPAAEAVQAAERGDDVLAGPLVQVIGVGEQDARADLPQRRRLESRAPRRRWRRA